MSIDRFHRDAMLALARVAEDAAIADGPEEALWLITRLLPSLMGDPTAAERRGNLPEGTALGRAAAAFMRTPDGQHHLVTAPVNFRPEQHHEKIPIGLGHPGHVAQTHRAAILVIGIRIGIATEPPTDYNGR